MSQVSSQSSAPYEPQSLWRGVLHQISGVALLGFVGTLIAAYFQNLSAYEDKVAALAQSDMASATQTFTDTSNALSSAMTLQQRLIDDFYKALPNDQYKDDVAYPTKDARAIYQNYTDAYSVLAQNYNLFPRKAQIYLDWASDPTHDAAKDSTASTDPISMSMLGEYNFDCENNMPVFTASGRTISVTNPHDANKPKLTINWLSAQHNVFAIEYCFDTVHRTITAVQQWASQSAVDPDQISIMKNRISLYQTDRPTSQVLRLNAFMSLSMSQLERIRVKYRPNGYLCSVPIANALADKQCAPVKTAD